MEGSATGVLSQLERSRPPVRRANGHGRLFEARIGRAGGRFARAGARSAIILFSTYMHVCVRACVRAGWLFRGFPCRLVSSKCRKSGSVGRSLWFITCTQRPELQQALCLFLHALLSFLQSLRCSTWVTGNQKHRVEVRWSRPGIGRSWDGNIFPKICGR
jgi:hypothetical protein